MLTVVGIYNSEVMSLLLITSPVAHTVQCLSDSSDSSDQAHVRPQRRQERSVEMEDVCQTVILSIFLLREALNIEKTHLLHVYSKENLYFVEFLAS